jgi:hypothetical protein
MLASTEVSDTRFVNSWSRVRISPSAPRSDLREHLWAPLPIALVAVKVAVGQAGQPGIHPLRLCRRRHNCENGAEFIAAASRDWCRFSGTGAAYIDPGSPWQNPYVESFSSRARDELFAREIFDSILEAKVLYADWCHAYNVHRPHSALGYQPAAAFAKAYSHS